MKLGDPPPAAYLLLLVTLAALAFEWIFAVSRMRRLRVDQLHVLAVRAVQAGVAPPPGVLTSAAPTTASQIVGSIMLVTGAGLASVGGLVVLAILAAAILQPPDGLGKRFEVLLGGGILGALPLTLGVVLFASGLRRTRIQAPISPYVARPPASGAAAR